MANFLENRVAFQRILESLLGSKNVYFQPPENIKINYPAIIYKLETINKTNANNAMYKHNCKYSLTYISKNPDDDTVIKILSLDHSSMNARYIADGLYHTKFTIFYK